MRIDTTHQERRSRRTVLKGLAASASLFRLGAGRRAESPSFAERLRERWVGEVVASEVAG